MSTTVYNPFSMELVCRSTEKMLSSRPELKKAKRVLFGPVDHEATQRFIEEELTKIRVRDSERWNFDFLEERTLSPNGIYEWKPVTPQKYIRPIKRRPSDSEDLEHIEELYGNPEERLIRPKPIKQISKEEKMRPKNQHQPYQTQITDFMRTTKRSTSDARSDVTKKNDWNSDRPAKISRLTDFSS